MHRRQPIPCRFQKNTWAIANTKQTSCTRHTLGTNWYILNLFNSSIFLIFCPYYLSILHIYIIHVHQINYILLLCNILYYIYYFIHCSGRLVGQSMVMNNVSIYAGTTLPHMPMTPCYLTRSAPFNAPPPSPPATASPNHWASLLPPLPHRSRSILKSKMLRSSS